MDKPAFDIFKWEHEKAKTGHSESAIQLLKWTLSMLKRNEPLPASTRNYLIECLESSLENEKRPDLQRAFYLKLNGRGRSFKVDTFERDLHITERFLNFENTNATYEEKIAAIALESHKEYGTALGNKNVEKIITENRTFAEEYADALRKINQP